MGALTLKNFPFILRSWNVKSYDSINPTDSFGQNIFVYINKNHVVKIEPTFYNCSEQTWLTDKGRQFFDGIFCVRSFEKNSNTCDSFVNTPKQWKTLFDNINKIFYVFNICNLKNYNKKHFIIVIENVSIELLNFLSVISQINLWKF